MSDTDMESCQYNHRVFHLENWKMNQPLSPKHNLALPHRVKNSPFQWQSIFDNIWGEHCAVTQFIKTWHLCLQMNYSCLFCSVARNLTVEEWKLKVIVLGTRNVIYCEKLHHDIFSLVKLLEELFPKKISCLVLMEKIQLFLEMCFDDTSSF